MNTPHFFAAATLFIASASGFAADNIIATTAVNVATVSAASMKLDEQIAQPVVAAKSKGGGRSRAEVRAEAVEFVKNYKTSFEVYLENFKG